MEKIVCSLCNGRGEDVEIECRNCDGTGYDPEEDKPFAQCHTCYGTGDEELDICPECHGDGVFVIDEEDFFEEETLIYTFPEPELYVPENRIITDLALIRGNVPELISFLSNNPQYLYTIEPREFEQIIAEIFRKKGFEVTLTKRTRDGGKDIIAIYRHELGIDTKYFIFHS